MKLEALKREVAVRKKARTEIRCSINTFCEKEFGIMDFFGIVDKYFPDKTQDFQVCLARQVPTPNLEHLALYLATKSWNLEPLYLSLTRDSFPQQIRGNQYKKSLICSPQVFRGRKGNLVVQAERFSNESLLQNSIISDLETKSGRKLPEAHWSLMEKALPNPPRKIEMSGFFREVLMSATKNLPECVFIRQGRKEKISRCGCVPEDDPRPPASWYYFFHLLLFVGGSRALASTIDEDPEVIEWFRENNQKIKKICGFSPLILDTPLEVEVDGFYSKLNEIPRKALGGNGFLPSLPKPQREVGFFGLMKYYEEQLLAHA